jgi:hypothetical protein
MLLLEKNRGKTKKNRYFTEIEPYLYEFDELNHVLAFTHGKLKLFEIW